MRGRDTENTEGATRHTEGHGNFYFTIPCHSVMRPQALPCPPCLVPTLEDKEHA